MKKKSVRGFVFYTQDYFGAIDVRLLPLELRCVWIEMFLLMDQSPRRGVLLKKNGEAYAPEELAVLMHCEPELVRQTTERVIKDKIANVDRATGAIANRKMMREEKRRKIGAKFGRKGGGNPALKATVNLMQNERKIDAENAQKSSTKNCNITAQTEPPQQLNSQKKNKIDDGLTYKGQATPPLYTTDPDPDPEPELRRILIDNSSPVNSPAEKQPGRPRDQASDFFAEQCFEKTGAPYVPEHGDFVMLAKLRKGFGTENREQPPGWPEAVTNYFASPLSQYSLADLANPKRYAVFKNSALDEFNKPINRRTAHVRQEQETRGEILVRKQKESGERVRELLRGSTGDGVGTSDTAGKDSSVRPGLIGFD